MEIKQVELVDIRIKPLKSLDKSLMLKFYINLNKRNNVNVEELHNLLFKPLKLNVEKD